MALPLLALGAGLGLKALGGLFKKKAQDKAGKEKLRSETATFKQGEGSRINRNAASQALLKSLFGGKYAVDPTAFGTMQQEKAYTGADPTKGSTWNMLGGGASTLGNAAVTAGMMGRGSQSAGTGAEQAGPLLSEILGYPDLPAGGATPSSTPIGMIPLDPQDRWS